MFKLFLKDEVINFLVDETKDHAPNVLQQIVTKCNSRFKEWKPTNADEMKLFLDLLIHMGAANFQRLSDYWSSKLLFKTYNFGVLRYLDQMSASTRLPFHGSSEQYNATNLLYERGFH